MRTEYPKYYEAIDKHPRLLVGQKVPRADGSDGEEVLHDSQDAKEWQEAVKQQLAAEVEARVDTRKEELSSVFDTVHSSIDLFRNNTDLVPGTKQFDRELADEFATFAKPYELRSDGKLMGYSVPVQPMINQIRTQIAGRRAAAPAAPAAPAGAPAPHHSAEQARTPQGQFDGPQAGLQSKAGQSGGGDDVGGQVLDAFLRQNGVSI